MRRPSIAWIGGWSIGASLLAACGGASDAAVPDMTAAVAPTTMPVATPVSASPATTTPGTTPGAAPVTTVTETSRPTTFAVPTTTVPATLVVTTTAGTTVPPPPMTSCTSVAHIGDSTGVYLWDPEFVGGDPANTLDARYRSVGVERIVHDDEGGRAIVELLAPGRESAVDVARRVRAGGFRGCWVVMIGTNDAANIAAGAAIGADDRIERLLDVVDGEPLLWVDAATLRTSTEYGNDAMLAWNAVLARYDAELEHLVVADWSARAQPGWFQPDGIHYTEEGRIWRAAITALELAEAFPST